MSRTRPREKPQTFSSIPHLPRKQIYEKYGEQIPQGSVVVEFAFSHHGLTTFCMEFHRLQNAEQLEFSFTETRRVVLNYIRKVTELPNDPIHAQARSQDLFNLCNMLSEKIIAPIAKHLHKKSHVIFVPSHPALAFPLSALLYQGEPLFLNKAVSQAPSLSVLVKLTSKPSTTWPPNVSALAKPGSLRSDIQKLPLKMAGIEAFMIANTYEQRLPDAKNMDNQEFIQLLERSDIVDVGTHRNVDARSDGKHGSLCVKNFTSSM